MGNRVPWTVMVVDDDASSRELLEAYLQSESYQVVMATNGLFAIESAKKSPPDLILLDLSMPGMSGFEVSRRLRSNPGTASTPIIVVTTMQKHCNMEEALACGADDFLTKPVREEDLLARVGALLKVSDTRKEIDRLVDYLVILEQERQVRRHALSFRQEPGSSTPPAQGEADPGTVLVVGGTPASHSHVRQFQAAGYQVLAASSVEEAWAATARQRPDAVMVDFAALWPAAEGLVRYLSRSQPPVPVILTLPPTQLESRKLPVPPGFFGVLTDDMNPALATGILRQAIWYGRAVRRRSVTTDRSAPREGDQGTGIPRHQG